MHNCREHSCRRTLADLPRIPICHLCAAELWQISVELCLPRNLAELFHRGTIPPRNYSAAELCPLQNFNPRVKGLGVGVGLVLGLASGLGLG